MANSLIGSVSVSPPHPRPGESFHVQVLDPNGRPYTDRRDVNVFIQGVIGGSRTLQFLSPGDSTVTVRVVQGRTSETHLATVTVAGAPVQITKPGGFVGASPLVETAILWADYSYGKPYQVTFSVGAKYPAMSLTRPQAILERPRAAAAALAALQGGGPSVGKVAQAVASIPGVRVERVATTALAGRAKGRSITSVVLDLGETNPARAFASAVSGNAVRAYRWDFGDGTTTTTFSPSAAHDYSPSLRHDANFQSFQVVCHLPGGDSVEKTLTIHSAYAVSRRLGYIVLPAAYNLLADRSWVPYDSGGRFGFQAVVSNPEAQSVQLTHRAFVAHEDDPSGSDLRVPAFETIGKPVTIPAGKTVMMGILAQATGKPGQNVVSWNATGFTAYFAGTAADGTPVRLTMPCEIPYDSRGAPSGGGSLQLPLLEHEPWPWEIAELGMVQILTDPGDPLRGELNAGSLIVDQTAGLWTVATDVNATGLSVSKQVGVLAARLMAHALNPVRPAGIAAALAGRMATDPDRALAAMAIASGVSRVARSAMVSGIALNQVQQSALPPPAPSSPNPPQPGAVAEGQICDPFNILDADAKAADAQQLVCSATGETGVRTIPSNFANARKGDLILSPGGPGIIAELLRNVSPPQQWSHSGIMTRNLDEITHSTASQSRLLAHQDGTKGFERGPLIYGWPAAVTQAVNSAVYGEPWQEPNGTVYSISSFEAHPVGGPNGDGFDVVPPMVIKPDPFQETAAVHTTLHGVADEAAALGAKVDMNGKLIKPHDTNYRFNSYTDPTIADPAKDVNYVPGPGGWPNGTIATVCSSQRHELVQDTPSIPPVARRVTSGQRNHQFISCRHADLPHLRPRRCIPVGSKLNEATGQLRGTFQARQCAPCAGRPLHPSAGR